IGAATAKKRGLAEIRDVIVNYKARSGIAEFMYDSGLEADIGRISALLSGDYNISAKAVILLLLQGDEEIAEIVRKHEKERSEEVINLVKEIRFKRRESFNMDLSMERKRIVGKVLEGVIELPDKREITLSERISRLAVRPLTGVPLLLIVLYFGLYLFVAKFGAGTLVDLTERKFFEGFINPYSVKLAEAVIPWQVIRELFVGEYGLVTLGLRYAVGIILPIVATFFLFFSILEDSGYFPRLALLVDRIFKRIGLTGRAVIPMVLGFGCDTMATMVTRTLETKRERIIATLLLALSIPCSAQLGVILALLSKSGGALLIWSLTLLLIFLLVGVLSSKLMPGETPMFYMELPPMRLPQLSNVITKTYTRMQWYFLEILPLFLLVSVLLWLGKITNFFDRVVTAFTPVMAALGLPKDVTVAFIFGFFRRDYGAAGLFDLQRKGILDPRQLTVAAVTLTLFIPCIAQFMVMKKERGWKVSISIGLFVSVVAFSSGWLLNRLLIATNLL
ncbi:MAG: ferrous iron transporter B, partial [Desulfuromonadales bacterium]|nr:ferrous iron transporter B [Desulfuromonadales bacterium]